MNNTVTFERSDSKLVLHLNGRIDSNNASKVDEEILPALQGVSTVEVDCSNLTYVSSAGLRVILRIRKSVSDMVLTNVSNEVYDIFQLTGFTEMMDIRKAFRRLNVEGCEIIGQGANGTVYRYDPETIVKVFKNPNALPDIQRERELARTAFVLGVPTAIAYDIVQVENGLYGSVFELLNADSYQTLLVNGTKTVDEIAEMSAEILRTVHSRVLKPGVLPSKKEMEMEHVEQLKGVLPDDQFERLHSLFEGLPDTLHMVHGDFHIKNIMVQNGESLLIDMDTLCTGDPIFEFSGLYVPYCGFSEINPDDTMRFFNIPRETARELFTKTLNKYLEGTGIDPETALIKARIIAYSRLLYYTVIGKHMKPGMVEPMRNHTMKCLSELLPQVTELCLGYQPE